MINYSLPFIGFPLGAFGHKEANLPAARTLATVAGFFEDFDVDTLDRLIEAQAFDDYAKALQALPNEAQLMINWMISEEAREFLQLKSHYHGSAPVSALSLEYVDLINNISIPHDTLSNVTWNLSLLQDLECSAGQFRTFCKETMPDDLFQHMAPLIGLSILNVTS